MKRLYTQLVVLAATGFGLGCSPVAPGTVGALGGLVFLPWMRALNPVGQGAVAVALAAVAVPLCGCAERFFGVKDDRRIVADEYLTLPIALIGVPWPGHPWLLVAAFILSRLADMLKPPPARSLQKLPGGFGIVADDVVSCLYTCCILHVVTLAMAYLPAA